MATFEETAQALLDAIYGMAVGNGSSLRILRLAEAYAWVTSPSQPHGGSAQAEK